MFHKWDKINFEFNDKFYTKGQIMKAVDKKLRSEGRTCTIIDIHYIIVDGRKYRLKEERSESPELNERIKKITLTEVPKVNFI